MWGPGHSPLVAGAAPARLWRPALALMLGGVGLGWWGFALLDDRGSYSALDDLYRALQLLVLDAGATAGEEPVPLLIGRVAAPLGAALAAIQALLVVFRADVERIRLRRLRDHVVVAGLGAYGVRLALSFRQNGFRVVAIERDVANPALADVARAGITVLAGDAADPELLERAGLGRARYLVVTCGVDGTNVGIAAAAEAAPGRRRPLTAFVHLDDLRLWPYLRARAMATTADPPFRLEFFNVFDAGARILLDRHPPFAAPAGEDRAPHVVLLGLAGAAESVLLHLAGLWQAERRGEDQALRVTVVAPGGGPRLAALLARHPRLGTLLDLDARVDEADLAALERDPALEGVSAAYVCTERETDGVASALALAGPARAAGARLVLVLDDEQAGLATVLRGDGASANVEVFGVLSRTLPPELLVRGTNEIIARAKHEHYVLIERARGEDPRTNPSVVAWEALPESLKESNRAFADRIGPKLEAADCALVPDPLADGAAGGFAFSPDEVEELARMEHEGWCESLRRDGWRRGGPPKDPERRLHPLLVPWEELPEDEREKDRDPVRALPRLVARAGFQLVRVGPASAAAGTASSGTRPTPGPASAPSA